MTAQEAIDLSNKENRIVLLTHTPQLETFFSKVSQDPAPIWSGSCLECWGVSDNKRWRVHLVKE